MNSWSTEASKVSSSASSGRPALAYCAAESSRCLTILETIAMI